MGSGASISATQERASPDRGSGWSELWRKEDWWAVWVGLATVLIAYAAFAQGTSIGWIAVAPAKWSSPDQLLAQLSADAVRYVAQFVVFAAVFTAALTAIGQRPSAFLGSFVLVYLVSLGIFVLGAWDKAQTYNLEPPLIALFLGLLIANTTGIPASLSGAFRVEFYIKLGIVLLGATLPFTLILWAGPVAILQASIVSILTFLVIFFVARKLGLDHRLAATLGAGGAVCGVSASIAIAGAVRARKEDPPIAITLVVLWAIVLIFLLPLVARALGLPAGVGGAWIGTSEFADAAGFAAAQAYGGLAGPETGIAGTADQAVWAYTLIKVVGRDVWIGIWALVLSLISVTYWERSGTGGPVEVGQIWWRFPKFVVGFLLASILVTVVTRGISFADYNAQVKPTLIAPITSLRIWAFTFSFLSIGLTTRFRDFAPAGGRPAIAFTAGVVVNLVVGFVLSVLVFGSYWAALAK
ncbi:YeiH family protein [Methylobacterium sp. J-048]|uniref:YeiH family protein n=1 Tax=Methylobacterium sp. J-048 TaxID=2836635 RepID=UPI001FBB4272|nr:putative sulfate exporter family transporter [Methylobacterium sp. J-048]MCJ2056242.1 YeiH family protein [Methylobacterium sp. J-048]